MLVPLNMLWRVQISLRRKLGLAGIFSLTVFIMIIAIIRVTIMYGDREQADGTWLWTWSSVEQTVGMWFQKLFLPVKLLELMCFAISYSHHRGLPCLFPRPVHTAGSLSTDPGSEGYVWPHPVARQ